jgi:23S rRNA (adenine2503-C2)-methyltransferase
MAETAILKAKGVRNIRQLSYTELEDFFLSIDEKKFRVKQLWEWLWQKHAHSFADMTNLSKELRQKLGENFTLPALTIHATQQSADGTVKPASKRMKAIFAKAY